MEQKLILLINLAIPRSKELLPVNLNYTYVLYQ